MSNKSKNKTNKTDSKPAKKEEEIGLFLPLTKDEKERIEGLAKADHDCPPELFAKKLLFEQLNTNFLYSNLKR